MQNIELHLLLYKLKHCKKLLRDSAEFYIAVYQARIYLEMADLAKLNNLIKSFFLISDWPIFSRQLSIRPFPVSYRRTPLASGLFIAAANVAWRLVSDSAWHGIRNQAGKRNPTRLLAAQYRLVA